MKIIIDVMFDEKQKINLDIMKYRIILYKKILTLNFQVF